MLCGQSPDADLYIQCLERIRYAKRDVDRFRQYGYDEHRLKAFLDKVIFESTSKIEKYMPTKI